MEALFDAMTLGIVEGITEFIPVSSTGHLILAEKLISRSDMNAKLFDVIIQTGAILAVIWSMRHYLFSIVRGLPSDPQARHITVATTIAFFPAAVVGAASYHFIKQVLFSPAVVGSAMIVGGVIILLIEKMKPIEKTRTLETLSLKTALLIGIFQITALIPGISRSGASIIGALALGVERKTASEFSFLLAIPTILGAAAYDTWQSYDLVRMTDLPVFITGIFFAFISALVVIRWFLRFIGSHSFAPFAYYRIGAGFLVLALLAFK